MRVRLGIGVLAFVGSSVVCALLVLPFVIAGAIEPGQAAANAIGCGLGSAVACAFFVR